MKVHELAKELGLSSKEIIAALSELKVKVKGHMSVIESGVADLVKKKYLKKSMAKKPASATKMIPTKKEVKKKIEAAKEEARVKEAPVKKGPKKKPEVGKKALPAQEEPLKKELKKKIEVVLEPPEPKEELPKKEHKKKIEAVLKPPAPKPAPKEELPKKELELNLPISVKDLAIKLQVKISFLIKKLMDFRVLANINQTLSEDIVNKVIDSFGYRLKVLAPEEDILLAIHKEEDKKNLKSRAPVVTLMGHVDHGKTSLLDAIRKTNVTEREHGGITQHIGAYEVTLPKSASPSGKNKITFLDTPGHEAFTSMRMRGANITDIVILVVAADDGIMPQTIEAIDHARAAKVPIIVAINKMDKPQADINRVKKQLAELDLASEDWGGKTITVPVSAKTGEGVNNLLEMVLLEAEMLELKANFDKPAYGVVIDAKLTQGKGPVATVLVRSGKLSLGDCIIAGLHYGNIKAMFNDQGRSITEAYPVRPVEALGLSGTPQAGEEFFVLSDEKKAREICLKRQEKEKQNKVKPIQRISLDELYSQIKEGKIKELNIILKADVQGSLGALRDSLAKLPTNEVQLKIIHSGVGAINRSDIILAAASNAVIIGFHVEPDTDTTKEFAEKELVDIRCYRIIYEAIGDIRAALEGLLEPKIKKVFMGRIEIRKVFDLSRGGKVAGCFVQKGKVNRSTAIEVIRNGEILFEGKLSSLKRFKDDVREVTEGLECGLTIGGFDDIKEGDIVEAYELQKVARTLEK
ncbi:MAG: translation initiation factor IF-2 [Candidatus Omnitrophota bacterium]